ncbi:MAG TPA: hypothetical protein VMO26_10615 [Vicinamibacterales bacterium]|nr:hypothetical protein [Vicinamibacterales bacterium]
MTALVAAVTGGPASAGVTRPAGDGSVRVGVALPLVCSSTRWVARFPTGAAALKSPAR